MRTRAQAAEDRRELRRQIEREHKRAAKAKIADLRRALLDARERRKTALRDAKHRCRAERLAARDRIRAMRVRALEELRIALKAERLAARQTCSVRLGEARAIKDEVRSARTKLHAERRYQADLRRIELGNRKRTVVLRKTAREARSESDDEVRTNLPPELVSLFERVKRSIKGSARASRTEVFLKYAEEHPAEVLVSIDDQTDALIRDLERREREARREMRRGPPRRRYTAAELAETPF